VIIAVLRTALLLFSGLRFSPLNKSPSSKVPAAPLALSGEKDRARGE
jgi:hypothetical protein